MVLTAIFKKNASYKTRTLEFDSSGNYYQGDLNSFNQYV